MAGVLHNQFVLAAGVCESGRRLLEHAQTTVAQMSDQDCWGASLDAFVEERRDAWNEQCHVFDTFRPSECEGAASGWSTQIRLENGNTSDMSDSSHPGAHLCDALDRAIAYEASGQRCKLSISCTGYYMRLRPKRNGPKEELWSDESERKLRNMSMEYTRASPAELFWVTHQSGGPWCYTLRMGPSVEVLQFYLLAFQRDHLTRQQHEQIMALTTTDAPEFTALLDIARNLDCITEIRTNTKMRAKLEALARDAEKAVTSAPQ